MARINPRLPHHTAAAVLGVGLFFSSAALADDVHKARVLYQKGNAAFKKGDSILARDFYEKSLAQYDSFDTRCNLGRAQANDQLFKKAYFNLGVCVEMYPEDKELADARARFVGLKNDVRSRLGSEDALSIRESVTEHMEAWRAERVKQSMPASGLGESPEEDVESQVGSESEMGSETSGPAMEKVGWKLPVVISLAGAGVVSGVVGGVMFGVAGGHQGDADDLLANLDDFSCAGNSPPSECAAINDSLEKRDSATNLGIGLAAAGGGLLLGSLAVALIVPSEKQVTSGWKSVRPDVVVGAREMSFGLSGRF